MLEIDRKSGLGLIDIASLEIGQSRLTVIRVIQPDISVSFPKQLGLRRLLINRRDQTLWIVYGPPDSEPDLQTISYKYRPTKIRLRYEGPDRCFTLKINL